VVPAPGGRSVGVNRQRAVSWRVPEPHGPRGPGCRALRGHGGSAAARKVATHEMAAFPAFLDTCADYGGYLCDTLLRLAEAGAYLSPRRGGRGVSDQGEPVTE
jgi:hypothetical protein